MPRPWAPGRAAKTLLRWKQRCVAERVAGTDLGIGSVSDQLGPDGAISIRDQGVDRHRDLKRITVKLLAIGKSELHGLQHEMDIVSRIMSQTAKIEILQDRQRLQQHGSLIPGTAFVDLRPGILNMHAALDRNLEPVEIRLFQKAALVLDETHDLRGNIAAIEGVEHRAQPSLPASGAGLFRL